MTHIIGSPTDSPAHRKKVREKMLYIPLFLPDRFDNLPRPEKPFALSEYRFNASGQHICNFLGAFPSEIEAKKAGLLFLDAAADFMRTFHGKYMGNDLIDGRTYQCYALHDPLDIMGFAYGIDELS